MTAIRNTNDMQSRLIGVGQAPTDQVAQSVMCCGFTQVPVIESVAWTIELPVMDGLNLATFGDEIDILQGSKNVPGVTSVDSSFVINGILQVDMLVIGFGLHAFAEPQQGSQICNWVNPSPAANAVPVSPDVFTSQDIAVGALGLAEGQTITPAILEWGAPAQNAMWHLVNAYRFQWIMQQRYLLINELAADVAYFGSYAEAQAAGDSQEAFQRFARRANNAYANQGATGAAVPINAQRIDSVTATNNPLGNTGVFHPTRSFDLMDMTWGGLRVQGGAACCSPFRRCLRPVLLEKGIPIGMSLKVQDEFHQNEMLRYLSQTDNQGPGPLPGVTAVAFAAASGGLTNLTATSFPELTLDTPATLFHQQVQTDRILLKGGAAQLSILIKGFEVWGPWKQYIQQQMVPAGLVTVPGQTAGVGMLPARLG